MLFLDHYAHRVLVAHARPRRAAVGQDGLDTLATTQHRQVALVGKHDGLGAPVCADHHWIGVGADRTKASEK